MALYLALARVRGFVAPIVGATACLLLALLMPMVSLTVHLGMSLMLTPIGSAVLSLLG